MILKELKFLIRQIVREEIIDLVREKNISLIPPKTIFVDKKSKFSEMRNPFLDEDIFDKPMLENNFNKKVVDTTPVTTQNEDIPKFVNPTKHISAKVEDLKKRNIEDEFEKNSIANGRDLFKI